MRLFDARRDRFIEPLRNGEEDSEEAAGLFYFLKRTSYNGLCRFKRPSEFNEPFESYRTINYTRDFP